MKIGISIINGKIIRLHLTLEWERINRQTFNETSTTDYCCRFIIKILARFMKIFLIVIWTDVPCSTFHCYIIINFSCSQPSIHLYVTSVAKWDLKNEKRTINPVIFSSALTAAASVCKFHHDKWRWYGRTRIGEFVQHTEAVSVLRMETKEKAQVT